MQPYDEIHPGEFQSSEKGRPAPTARVVARLGVLDELRKHERSTSANFLEPRLRLCRTRASQAWRLLRRSE
jgi:hypothetical protein